MPSGQPAGRRRYLPSRQYLGPFGLCGLFGLCGRGRLARGFWRWRQSSNPRPL